MQRLTDQTFETEVSHAILPVIVVFYARWCPKCAIMKPVLEDLERKYSGKIRFFEAEISESGNAAAKYNTSGVVPAFVLFKKEKVVGTFQGMVEEDTFERRIKKIFINC